MFTGAAFERNLRAVAELDRLAHNELGASVDQLATAWTLANPAVQVAIVGTRQAAHVDAAVAAADLHLDESVLAAIDEIVRSAQDPTSHGSGRV
jgi:aryl-alcohol dehydrogenase-like predicted oxidoreductase